MEPICTGTKMVRDEITPEMRTEFWTGVEMANDEKEETTATKARHATTTRVLLVDPLRSTVRTRKRRGRLYPNLALMKAGTYFKKQGATVGWDVTNPDAVVVSIVFERERWIVQTLKNQYPYATFMVGGPGFDPSITSPWDAERPDYDLYPDFRGSIGRVTIGCPRHCPFCLVPKMGPPRCVQHINKFYREGGGPVVLLDDNLLANHEAWIETSDWLIEHDIEVRLEATDIRLVDADAASRLSQINYGPQLRFSWDNTKDEPAIMRGIRHLMDAGITGRRMMFYLYMKDVAAIPDAAYRFDKLRALNIEPFLMIERTLPLTKRLRAMQRRAIRPAAYRKMTTREVFGIDPMPCDTSHRTQAGRFKAPSPTAAPPAVPALTTSATPAYTGSVTTTCPRCHGHGLTPSSGDWDEGDDPPQPDHCFKCGGSGFVTAKEALGGPTGLPDDPPATMTDEDRKIIIRDVEKGLAGLDELVDLAQTKGLDVHAKKWPQRCFDAGQTLLAGDWKTALDMAREITAEINAAMEKARLKTDIPPTEGSP